MGVWGREDYERQWIEAARRLLDGADRTGFFTAAMWRWWTMWLKGHEAIVHEQILVPEALIEPLEPTDPYRQIDGQHPRGRSRRPAPQLQVPMAARPRKQSSRRRTIR